jgi:probable phosphoglycerate mutase
MSPRTLLAATVAAVLSSAAVADAATFLFIRHAESTTNDGSATTPEEILDPPLTVLGQQQALDLVDVLAGYDLTRIYVSSYQRTALTIAPTAAARGLTPVVEPEIREWSFGDGTSPLDYAKIYAMFGQWLAGNTAARIEGVPDSESLDDLVARVVPAYQAIFDAHWDEDGTVAIIGHGGSIGWVMPFFVNNVTLPFALSNNLRNTGIVTVVADRNGDPTVTDWDGIAVEPNVPAPVPLPAGGLLLAAALAALGAAARARKAA